MDDPAQAAAYAGADFAGPNAAFVAHVERALGGAPLTGTALDLGCGPADICARLARRYPLARIDALDGSRAMLTCARQRLAREPAARAARIRLIEARLPAPDRVRARHYGLIVSNSLLHHLPDPGVLWNTVRHAGRPGCRVVVMDLFRAASPDAARALVDRYAADEPAVLRTDFYHSLLAAFTVDEVHAQLRAAGLTGFRIEPVSDRHLLVSGRLPG
ncbi:MAG: class I SAM-dependent methyltransferase [Pseudomonadales bacterium]|nr:class I SAM-dependent methyltransferase [Pseudomonadales bacterium]